MDPSNVNVHNSLGVCFGLMGNYEPAIEAFKTAVAQSIKMVVPAMGAICHRLRHDQVHLSGVVLDRA